MADFFADISGFNLNDEEENPPEGSKRKIGQRSPQIETQSKKPAKGN